MSERATIRNLAERILQAKHLYYKGTPVLSDTEYDKLETKLQKLDPAHPVLQMVGSGSEGKDAQGDSKIAHATPMLSLRKTYALDELFSWVDDKALVGTPKLDGNSLSLVYEQGVLVQAKTRGDGRRGEDVFDKISYVTSIPNKLKKKQTVEVRGELICSMGQFVKLQAHMQSIGLEVPTNPRNTVAGILGRKTHGDLAVYFDFFAFDAIGGKSGGADLAIADELQKMDWLASSDFTVPDYQKLGSRKSIEDFLATVKVQLEEGEWAMDGAVFTYNDTSMHSELGETSHHPRYKMVFKWQGESATTKVEAIDWRTSRAGILTPVAIVQPVELSGATISNVTLHNYAFAKNTDVSPGDTIEIVRSGEVIPKYLDTVAKGKGRFSGPQKCSACGSGLEMRDEVRIYCANKQSCPAQIIGGILHWVVQTEIEDLSEKRLEQMLEIGLVKSPADLYKLTADDLLQLPQTKEKLATKLVSNIKASGAGIELVSFLSGLGVPGGGKTSWQKIAGSFGSLERILELSVEEVAALDGFAEKSSETLVEGLKARRPWIDALLAVGVVPASVMITDTKAEGPLLGKTLVVTGTLSVPRKDIEKSIASAGGKAGKAVSKNTFALVCNDPQSTSSKAKKARELGIEIWSESDLREHIK